jgi:thiol-disulfide isomerase/thioredoxin
MRAAVYAVLVFASVHIVSAQAATATAVAPSAGAAPALPKITQIDIAGLRKVLKPTGKPLLVNFWATWCPPCRAEFPDLVKLDAEYRPKVDFVTVSLDELGDINTYVPQFLGEMKADMPAYLLHTPDESAAIKLIANDWNGNLPLTILFNPDGTTAYMKKGKIRYETLKLELDKVVVSPAADSKIVSTIDFVKIKEGRRDEALFYYDNNWRLYRDEAVKRGVIDSYELIDASSKTGSGFDLILITRYRGDEQLANSEKNFEPILKQLRPNGPLLKSELKPDDFRQSVFVYSGTTVFASKN